MIESIDFLPADYHRKRQRSRKTYWRSAVFAVFAMLVGAGAVRQRLNQRKLEATRDRLQRQADQMISQLQSTDVLKKQIKRLEIQSELIATLRYQAVPTRILQAVTNTLPKYVRLTRIQWGREKKAQQVRGRVQHLRRSKQKSKKQADKPPQQLDLEQLWSVNRNTQLAVAVEGVAPDDVAISQYLAALQTTGALRSVQLLFTDRYVDRGLSLRRFGIRLLVRRVGSAGRNKTSASAVSIGLQRRPTEVRN